MSYNNISIDLHNGLDWLKRKEQRLYDILQESPMVEMSSSKITLNMKGEVEYVMTKNEKHMLKFRSSSRDFDDVIMSIMLLCSFALKSRKGASVNSPIDQDERLSLFIRDEACPLFDDKGESIKIKDLKEGEVREAAMSIEVSRISEKTEVDGKKEIKQYYLGTNLVACVLRNVVTSEDKATARAKALMKLIGQ